MQALSVFLALLFAHLTGDFLLQSDRIVAGKRQRIASSYVEHALIHLLLAELALVAFAPTTMALIRTHAVLAGLVMTHVLVDLAKAAADAKRPRSVAAPTFFIDQGLHVLLLLGATELVAVNGAPLQAVREWLALHASKILVLATTYMMAVFATAYANAIVLAPYAERLKNAQGDDAVGLASAGRYIGWLERFLIVTAVLVGSPEAAGLVVAAKSVFRFGDIKEGRAFAEYFLIGTFLSVSEAVAIGLGASLLLAHLNVL